MPRHPSHLLELAKRGAEARFRELAGEMKLLTDEMKLLVNQFPHLSDSFDPDELPVSYILSKGRGRSPVPRRRKK